MISMIFDNLIPFIVVLGILVFIHELGHHLASKLFGMKVDAFSLGFPPRAWGFRWSTSKLQPKFMRDLTTAILNDPTFVKMHELLVEWGVSSAPDESVSVLSKAFVVESIETKSQVLNKKGKPEEQIEISTQVTAAKSAMHTALTADRMESLRAMLIADEDLVDDFLKYSEINNPVTFKEKYKTDYCLSWVPLGGYCKINGMVDESLDTNTMKEGRPKPWEYRAKPIWQRIIVISGGVFFNFILAAVVFMLMAIVSGVPDEAKYEQFKNEKITAKIGSVNPGGPADRAGLQTGDIILSINGIAISEWQQVTEQIRKNPDKTITIEWKRGNETMHNDMVTSVVKIQKDGVYQEIGQVGIAPEFPDYSREASVGEAVTYGFKRMIFTTAMIGFAIKQVAFGEVNPKDAFGGPVMIVRTTGEVKRQQGWEGIWNLMAILSISLAVFNLLPIPALDGGHLLILAIEGVIRRPLSIKFKIYAQQIGMAILLTLIVLIFFNDIFRLVVR